MRPLVVDDAAKAKAARVVAWAEAHPYHPGQPTPGDDPNFVATFNTYRAVFTYTHADGLVWRHLSVSVPGGKFPNPAAAFALAELFGFTGWDGRTLDRAPDDWLLNVNDAEHCIVLAQPLKKDPETKAAAH